MKYLFPIASLGILFSCGNPSSSSSDDGIDGKFRDSANAVIVTSYANARANYYYTSGGNGTTGQVCRDVIDKGTMRYFKYKSVHEFKAALKKAIVLDEDQLKSIDDSKSASLGVSIPLAKALAAFNGSYNSDHEEFESLKRKYRDNSTLDISDEDLLQIEMQVGDPTLIDAWKFCIKEAFQNERGIQTFTSGDEFSEFVLNLNYFPKSKFDPERTTVTGIDYSSNLKLIGRENIKEGATLENYTGLTQKFKRLENRLPAYIKISVEGFDVPAIDLIAFVPPPKNPVYEPQWMKEDEKGNKYFQAFVINHPECWDCSDDDEYIISSQTFNLDDKAGKVYEIKGECSGSGCGFNYSPPENPGGITRLSPTSFAIRRIIKGPVCSETYTAYYEKLRDVCIKNCQ